MPERPRPACPCKQKQALKGAQWLMAIYHESTLPYYVGEVLRDLCIQGCFIHFQKICLQAEQKVSLLMDIEWLL